MRLLYIQTLDIWISKIRDVCFDDFCASVQNLQVSLQSFLLLISSFNLIFLYVFLYVVLRRFTYHLLYVAFTLLTRFNLICLFEKTEAIFCLDRVMRNKLFHCEDFFGKNLPERKVNCDVLDTSPSIFATSIFADENFLLEGKNCKTQKF